MRVRPSKIIIFEDYYYCAENRTNHTGAKKLARDILIGSTTHGFCRHKHIVFLEYIFTRVFVNTHFSFDYIKIDTPQLALGAYYRYYSFYNRNCVYLRVGR